MSFDVLSLPEQTWARARAEVITGVELPELGQGGSGKVREIYPCEEGLALITTDRVSAFDRVLGHIPFKGQVLNQLSGWWFSQTRDIVQNHVLSIPDPNVTLGRRAQPLPVEVVVRGYLTGVTSTSLWTLYAQGTPLPYGLTLPPGLRKNDALPSPVVTPTTKATHGAHDERLTCDEVVQRGLVEAGLWERVQRVALALFARGQARAREAGLILVDTKYEFGLVDGELALIDEVHTPDSSRYWLADSWRPGDPGESESYDKEHLRLWLKAQGYAGDGPPPALSDAIVRETAARYVSVYERLTGRDFEPAPTPAQARIREALHRALAPAGEGELDRPRDACGVVGIFSPGVEVARTAFFALYALQHRGQESAGIATTDGQTTTWYKDMGLVSQVFNEERLRPLRGHAAIGHTRYSTTGGSHIRNAQPYVIETLHGPLGVGHNGNLTNAGSLRRGLLERGVGLTSSSDSEVITQMLAAPLSGAEGSAPDWEGRLRAFMERAEGAFALVVLTRDAVFGVRDPLGMRPLCLGELEGGWMLASESCALATVGARYVREVEPGEIVRLDAGGVHSLRPARRGAQALCVFEYVYFSRPDTLLEEQTVHRIRQVFGEALAREAPVEADCVIAVPDSAVPAAIGFAQASGLPYTEGLIKNRYIGRTFIQPDDRLRRAGVRLKYNPLRANLQGKRVVLIDDSIVRGNTAGPLVRLLRDAGASEVHVRVSSPPVRHPCFMGVDMSTYGELIAHHMDVEEIRRHIGADSLAYLSLEGMLRAASGGEGEGRHCAACFSGVYPVEVEDQQRGVGEKLRFEAKITGRSW